MRQSSGFFVVLLIIVFVAVVVDGFDVEAGRRGAVRGASPVSHAAVLDAASRAERRLTAAEFQGLFERAARLVAGKLSCKGLTRQGSDAAVILSTLGIAALFVPLRNRVQQIIDRRFYRQKYDASLALEEFSEAARREVAMDRLTSQMVSVVEKTVQPEQVSVWIRDRRVQE